MKNLFFKLLRTMPAVTMCVALVPCMAFGQQVTVNRVYDFSQNQDTLHSRFDFVFADSNRIFTMGEAHPQNADSFAFVAALDYSGNIIWERPVPAPNGLITTTAGGFDNLKKVRPNLYVAAGNITDAPKAGDTTADEPFLYFFDASGDSVNFMTLPDSIRNKVLNALAIDKDGNIIAGGADDSVTDTSSYVTTAQNFWFTRIDSNGNIIDQKSIPMLVVYHIHVVFNGHLPYVSEIIPVDWDTLGYLAVGYEYGPLQTGGILIGLNHQLSYKLSMLDFFEPIPPLDTLSGSLYVGAVGGTNKEFNFIPIKGYSHSFYWSLPAFISNEYGMSLGIYYCRCQYDPYGPYFNNIYEFYNLNWERALLEDSHHLPHITFPFQVQNRSSMAQAVNGDLLMEKQGARQSDTTLPSYLPQSGYYLPALFRIDSSGQTRWAMSFQHIPSTDSGLFYSFNALSVAPDGRIVLAGYVNAQHPVPGYDTVGKVSWLVVLNDSVHDNDSTAGITLSHAGIQAQVVVYPNPTLDYTTVELQHFKGDLSKVNYQLCDVNGRVLLNGKFSSFKENVPLENVASGVYFVKIIYFGKVCGNVKLVKG